MAFNIQEFKTNFSGGGARPNLFKVNITNPYDIGGKANTLSPFMIKASSIPSYNTGSITVPYFGREIKYAGDRTYEQWNVTVINDENFTVRNAFEEWMTQLNTPVTNLRAYPKAYKADAIVIQYGKNGEEIRSYKFVGMFPTTISSIELSWETNNTVEEFQVTFEYDYWELVSGNNVDNQITVMV